MTGNVPQLGKVAPVVGTKPATPLSLKYHAEITAIAGCPPPPSAPHTAGYRFAFSDLSNPNNFLPLARINPARFVGKNATTCCSSYALSMYMTLQQLRDVAAKAMKNSPKFLKRVGDHYACVQLDVAAGRCAPANPTGHFDFFEYEKFDPRKAVTAHGQL